MERKVNKMLMLLLCVLLVFTGCATLKDDVPKTMEDHWEKARSENTISAYEAFLEKYPNAMFSREELHAWQTAQTTNTVEAYEAFLQKYPKGLLFDKSFHRLINLLPPQKGKITGILKGKVGKPINGKEVSVFSISYNRNPDGSEFVGREVYVEGGKLKYRQWLDISDSSGRFSFSELPAGSYYLGVEGFGYVRDQTGSALVLWLRPGQTIDGEYIVQVNQ
jgi:hypothetical protein